MLVLKTFDAPRELHTRRTALRTWQDTDLPEWVAMNADPQVRRYFPTLLSPDEALAEAVRMRATLARRGWGLWALEVPGVLPFAGFVGLAVVHLDVPFAPALEIGWRLPCAAWGQGLASEAAAAVLEFAFTRLDLDEVVSFTSASNEPSKRVMRRLGLQHDVAADFEHPRIEAGHPLRSHQLSRIGREAFHARRERLAT